LVDDIGELDDSDRVPLYAGTTGSLDTAMAAVKMFCDTADVHWISREMAALDLAPMSTVDTNVSQVVQRVIKPRNDVWDVHKQIAENVAVHYEEALEAASRCVKEETDRKRKKQKVAPIRSPTYKRHTRSCGAVEDLPHVQGTILEYTKGRYQRK